MVVIPDKIVDFHSMFEDVRDKQFYHWGYINRDRQRYW